MVFFLGNKEMFYLFSMIKSNTFPQPLDKEIEEKYLKLCAEGDKGARNMLIEHNLRLVAHVAKKYDNKNGETLDDLVSIGTIGLIKAIESYTLGKGTKLSTYAAKCIENEILMYFRHGRKTKKDISLHDPIAMNKEGKSVLLMDVISTEQDTISDRVETKIKRKQMHDLIEHLDPREQKVLCWRFGILNKHEKTQRQIARELGISRSYVSRIEKRALIKLFHQLYRRTEDETVFEWKSLF
jgi:RNA polymerase sporulation-specific sigma factor